MNRVVKVKDKTLIFDTAKNQVSVQNLHKIWRQDSSYKPYIKINIGDNQYTLLFEEALSVNAEFYQTGVAEGLRCIYSGWRVQGDIIPLVLETLIWVNKETGRLYFEIIPLSESVNIEQVMWPAPFEWKTDDEQAYSVFPFFQGALIPSNWPAEIKGCGYWSFCEVGAPMPWFGQIDNGSGYIQIITTPWDCGYRFHHAANGPTEFYPIWKSSLGGLRYKRTVRMEFFSDCDYNLLCKNYRQYIKEQGKLITLMQKSLANPKIKELAGSPIIHSYIYYYIKPEALIYNKENADENYKFATFEDRINDLKRLVDKGLSKAYFHLDGWGIDGYDQQHPDILPPCEKAGGIEKMILLSKKCKEWNILFALHDQYRDYYLDCSTFDMQSAIHNNKMEAPGECTWNGGEQKYLCASLSSLYVERNYEMLERMGVKPDGVYLDVFSCVSLDECFHKEHTMTRKECAEYRASSMELLRARGIIVSSEQAVDTMIPHMELCHHAPFMGEYADLNCGIQVPLLNLVYHDCFITPWKICDNGNVNEISFLRALLYGGAAYLNIDADNNEIDKVNIISELQGKVAYSEMISHEFLNPERTMERTIFANGTVVTVDFTNKYYIIS